MARPPRKPAPDAPIDIDHEAIAADGAALTVLGARSAEIAERFGDGLPYHRERVIGKAQFFLGQSAEVSAEAMLEAGKALLEIKENEPWGEFRVIVEQRLKLSYSSANRMMCAAIKYLSPALNGKVPALGLLGRTKLFDLMDESDSDLAELAEGGTLAGKTLDDIEAMSARELKAALREAREDVDAKDKLLDTKNKKIDQLTADKKFKPSADRIARNAEQQAQLAELTEATNGAEVNFLRLAGVVDAITAGDSPAMHERARQAVQYLVKRLVEVVDAHAIEVNLDGLTVERPEWLNLLPPAGAGGAAGPANAG